ncbi:MAG TPA: GNAT family N-acetyltransferase [Candidatus Elarobacter sp.]|jgi:predicted acetyltransferase
MAATAATLAIRPLERSGEDPALIAALARLLVDAYPVMGITTRDALAAYEGQFPEILRTDHTVVVIAERDGVLAGAMRLYDYQMNVRGRDAFTGGVGAVAVALTHKRQGIARALIAWYLEHYRAREAVFAALHPFRLDFYRALGFGYGTPVHRFRFAPATLRADGARGTVRMLAESDLDALLECYERVRAQTNGLIAKHRAAAARALADAAMRYVAVEDAGAIRGFMQTTAAGADPALRNRDELIVRDLAYEDETYLAALLGYLRNQRDQFARIAIESQDAALYLAAADPRDGSDIAVAPPASHRVAETGLGIMYRILDVERALAHLPGTTAPFALRLDVDDPFQPAAGGTRTFRFGPRRSPQRDDTASPDATLTIGIHDLASVVLGSLRVRDVVHHRLATVEPARALDIVDAAFRADQPPVCTTRF